MKNDDVSGKTELEKLNELSTFGYFADDLSRSLIENGYRRKTLTSTRAVAIEAVVATILHTIEAVRGKDEYKIVATKTKESQQIKVEVFTLEDA